MCVCAPVQCLCGTDGETTWTLGSYKLFFARKCGYIYNVRTQQAPPILFLCIDSSPSLSQMSVRVTCNDSTSFFLAAVPSFENFAQTCIPLIACRCLSLTSRQRFACRVPVKAISPIATKETENEQTLPTVTLDS